MKMLHATMAAALVAATLLVCTGQVEAATANQYRAQGRGVYLTSKGNPKGWYRYGYRRPYGWHRSYRRW